ncbi:MAG: glycosyltransferase [Bdellovibrionota bacterium]
MAKGQYNSSSGLRVAVVHDWLVSQRGGENVLDAICELFPRAELFTLVYVPGQVSENIIRLKRNVSVLQKFPSATKRYRHLLPLMPWAIERFDLEGFDLVLSSSHCVAKGIRKPQGAFHLSYVHAPMRYMWDRFDEYFAPGRYGMVTRMAAHGFRSYLQNWDRQSATRVDHFLANSSFIASKIDQYYGRKARVVYPFCEVDRFRAERKPGRSYLMVTALVQYKRVDLAIKAFNQMKKPLLIVGDGPDKERLQKMAGPTIDFVGSLRASSIADLYSKCRALVFPGVEDFGIVPIEAMAAGAPVIAFGAGGLLETVTPETGVFFHEPTPEALIAAIEEFERTAFDSEACRKQGRQFTRQRFQLEFLEELKKHAPPRIASSLKIADNVLQPALV